MSLLELLSLAIFIISMILFIRGIISEWKKYKRKNLIKLKKEQEYPLAFTRFYTPQHRTHGHSASMTLNKFTDSYGKPIDPENYIGMIVCGSNFDNYGLYHGDLIFIKKNTTPEDLVPVEFIVVVKEDDHFLLRQLYEITGNIAKIIDGAGDYDTVDVKNIVGIVEYDFDIV